MRDLTNLAGLDSDEVIHPPSMGERMSFDYYLGENLGRAALLYLETDGQVVSTPHAFGLEISKDWFSARDAAERESGLMHTNRNELVDLNQRLRDLGYTGKLEFPGIVFGLRIFPSELILVSQREGSGMPFSTAELVEHHQIDPYSQSELYHLLNS